MLTRSSLLLVLGLASALVLVPGTFAQQTDTTQLPEIAPREIEIRGERQIALPSLERQPLTGFASSRSFPTVPVDRQPYLEPYEQELDDMPESLPVPEQMATSLEPEANPAGGFIQGGGGRYSSRFFESRVLVPISNKERVSFHGDYAGTEGFSPFAGDTVNTPSDVAEARVRFESRRDPVRINADVYGSAQSFTLYGTPRNPNEADRDTYSAGTSIRLASPNVEDVVAEVRYDHSEVTSHLFGPNQQMELDYREQQLGLDGTLTAPIALRPQAKATYTYSRFSGNARNDQAYTVDGRGTVSFFESDSSSLEVGAAVLSLDTPADPTTTSRAVGSTYVVPYVHALWRLNESARLFVRNRPQLSDPSLDHLYAQNPYAEHAPSLRPTVETTNARAGLTVTTGPVRLSASTGYRYAPTYRFFEPADPGGLNSGLFEVEYESAQIIEAEGQIGLQGIRGVHASVGVSVRNGTLGTTDTDIPNFATVTGNAMFSVSFADGAGFFEVLSEFEGPRPAGRAQSTQLDSYFTVDLEGSYAISSNVDVVVRAKNLAFRTPTLWQGYPRPPAEITTGLRFNW